MQTNAEPGRLSPIRSVAGPSRIAEEVAWPAHSLVEMARAGRDRVRTSAAQGSTRGLRVDRLGYSSVMEDAGSAAPVRTLCPAGLEQEVAPATERDACAASNTMRGGRVRDSPRGAWSIRPASIRPAAIDYVDLAGRETRLVTRQVGDQRGDLPRIAQPSHRLPGNEVDPRAAIVAGGSKPFVERR